MQQDVLFRGTKDGLLVVLNDKPGFAELAANLAEKLGSTGRFFRGAEVTVAVGQRELSVEQRRQIDAMLAAHGLYLRQFREGEPLAEVLGRPAPARAPRAGEAAGPEPAPAAAGPLPEREQPPLVVNRTLRSGQVLRHRGDVLIIGDVNPGAEVVATGHIVILGTLRGVAHAGASGDETAFVLALRLEPSQLRIGQWVGRAPDGPTQGGGAGVARVVEGRIVIEGRVP